MPTRDRAPAGSPCWTDLWTSDVEGSRRFYGGVFGWEAEEPSEEFGGYFMFTRDGVPVAGGMGPMEDWAPTNTWSVYLSTDDMTSTLEAAERAGAQIANPAMAVGDVGTQATLVDPSGARLGVWQPGNFPGFTVLSEHGTPSWFELFTRDHDAAVTFYRSVFHWGTSAVGDTDEFRYTVARVAEGEEDVAGIMDAAAFLPEDADPSWSVYWAVDDVEATAARVEALGGSVVAAPEDTPYGRLATVADPAGARFKLRAVAL